MSTETRPDETADKPEQPGPRFTQVDESFGVGVPHPSNTLRQVYRVWTRPDSRPFTIRVQVHADFHVSQSYARAEVLTPGLSWTELVVSPANSWRHGVIVGSEDSREALKSIAKGLLNRAITVLG